MEGEFLLIIMSSVAEIEILNIQSRQVYSFDMTAERGIYKNKTLMYEFKLYEETGELVIQILENDKYLGDYEIKNLYNNITFI